MECSERGICGHNLFAKANLKVCVWIVFNYPNFSVTYIRIKSVVNSICSLFIWVWVFFWVSFHVEFYCLIYDGALNFHNYLICSWVCGSETQKGWKKKQGNRQNWQQIFEMSSFRRPEKGLSHVDLSEDAVM